jgi:hypothetical protein
MRDKSLLGTEKISCGINSIPPVQPHLQKFSRSRLAQIKSISLAVPFHRGAFRDCHGRGAGCGGRGGFGRVM